jgi:hypothetical protein
VRLDEADYDIDSFALEHVRVFDHRVGLADSWCRADVDAEPRADGVLQRCQHLFAVPTRGFGHIGILARAFGARAALYELFMAFCGIR